MDGYEAIAPLAVNGKVAAWMLGVSERMFWELRNRGEIPHIKIGRLTRFAVEDLKRFLELKRIETEEAESKWGDEPPDEGKPTDGTEAIVPTAGRLPLAGQLTKDRPAELPSHLEG